jgi:hypothetical protein
MGGIIIWLRPGGGDTNEIMTCPQSGRTYYEQLKRKLVRRSTNARGHSISITVISGTYSVSVLLMFLSDDFCGPACGFALAGTLSCIMTGHWSMARLRQRCFSGAVDQ